MLKKMLVAYFSASGVTAKAAWERQMKGLRQAAIVQLC